MSCTACGAAIELVESEGGTTSGPFRETYRCAQCAATGTVSGDAGDPVEKWRRRGGVFAE